MRIYFDDTFEKFEFDKVRKWIAGYCRNRISRQIAESLSPIEDREKAKIILNQTEELRSVFFNKSPFPDTFFEEFEQEANMLQISGSVLNEKQFLKIKSGAEIGLNLVKYINNRKETLPHLALLTQGINIDENVIKQIDIVIDNEGIVRSSASKELYEIRKKIAAGKREVEKKFRHYLNELKKSGWVRENEEGYINGRRVVPVLAEYKRMVKGIIHGNSDSGKTVFLEPFETVEINNELAELFSEEKREEYKILKQLTNEIRIYKDDIKSILKLLAEIDFLRAKALFAIECNCSLPIIGNNPVIKLYEAFHPLLFLQNRSMLKETKSLNIELNSKRRILIISGPNAGGKSIVLKTIGLFQLMLQSGLLVPCKPNSEMCFYNHFLADIGDSQSIENELSTFSSRLKKMNTILSVSNLRALVLIDEFGTGTDPELGGALAEVVLEELNKFRCTGIITTHYTNIKILANKLNGVENACMLFDNETLKPLYKLEIGQPGSSFTFEVAEKNGISQKLIERAKAKVSADKIKLNNILKNLQNDKNALIKKEQELQMQKEKMQKAEEKYNILYDKIKFQNERHRERQDELIDLAEIGRRFKTIAEEWKVNKDKKTVIQKIVGRLNAEKKKLIEREIELKKENTKEKKINKIKQKIKEGSRVRILNSRQTGIVQQLKNEKAIVMMGNLLSTVSLENLEVVDIENS